VVSVFAIGNKVQAKDDGCLRAINIRSTTSFGGEVSRRPHVRCYSMLKNTTCMKEIPHRLHSRTSLAEILPTSLLGVSAGFCQRTVVDESGMIITQIETQNRS
jgi:hypothetical protein